MKCFVVLCLLGACVPLPWSSVRLKLRLRPIPTSTTASVAIMAMVVWLDTATAMVWVTSAMLDSAIPLLFTTDMEDTDMGLVTLDMPDTTDLDMPDTTEWDTHSFWPLLLRRLPPKKSKNLKKLQY